MFPQKERTHDSQVIRTFRLIAAPSTMVLTSFDGELVRSFMRPRGVLMVAIAARHLRSKHAALHKNDTNDYNLLKI
jgi:hypothetical protein